MAEATYTWVEVATLDDLWEGEILDVEVDGQLVLLAHLPGGRIVAYQGVCPHQEVALADGEVEETVLTCSAHLWQFDLSTGEGINPDNCQLYRYETRVEGETIYVGYPPQDTRRYNRCREEEKEEE
jgi:toluene monooxygenase system ferredoxin subunit